MTSRLAALGLSLLTAGTAVFGWQQPAPAAQAPAATGLILGRVVDAESNAPLPGVVVTLVSDAVYAAVNPEQGGPPPRVITNGRGQFVFRRLPRGRYNLTATVGGSGFSPNGFLVTGLGFQIGAYLNGAYGQRRPGGPTQAIDLDDGQRMVDTVVRLWKGGAIDGTVYDEAGDALVGVIVSAVRRSSDGRLITGPTTPTDDRGMYHFGTLMPGEYVIVVPQTQVLMPSSTIDAVLASPPDPLSAARFRNAGAPPPPTAGLRAGASIATIAPDNTARVINTLPATTQSGATYAYQTTFYPGATTAARATSVAIASGQEKSDLDIRLRPVRTMEISGTLTDASGPVPDFGVHLAPLDDGDGASVLEVATTATDGRGIFTFPLVASGQYTVFATRTAAVPTLSPGRGAPPPPPPDPRRVAEMRGAYASQPINVGDQNVAGLTLTLRPGVHVTGRIDFHGTSTPLPAPRLRQIGVLATRVPVLSRNSNAASTSIDPTGKFDFPGIPPGRYFIGFPEAIPAAFFAPWSVESITMGGRSVDDALLTIEDDTEMVITLTDQPAEIGGTLETPPGSASVAAVYLFPKDATRWADGRGSTRSFRAATVTTAGTFRIQDVMPGDYLAVAMRDDGAGDWPDQKFLQKISGSAASVRVAPAQKVSLSLKLSVVR